MMWATAFKPKKIDPLKPEDVMVERSTVGIYAFANVYVPDSKTFEKCCLWARLLRFPSEDLGLSDDEIKKIVTDKWNKENVEEEDENTDRTPGV